MEASGGETAKPIYLDYNATTPIDPLVAEAMLPFLFSEFGNPSSGHVYGKRAKAGVEAARTEVAQLVKCYPDEVVFTSGGTEANNWAIRGAARALRPRGTHLVTTAVEHPAVSEVVDYLCREEGFHSTVVPVDSAGQVSASDVARAVTEHTTVVSVMLANNEVGSMQPVAEIARLLAGRGVVLHTDASQAVGKVPVDFRELGVDLLTIAGHKLYAPKGVGALIVRRGTPLGKLMHGAGHERGLRAGTESTLLIAGLGKACEVARFRLEENSQHMAAMRERLLTSIQEGLTAGGFTGGVKTNGPADSAMRLPNTLSISFCKINGTELLDTLLPELACSAGSACHSGHLSISASLAAMGIPAEFAAGTLRLSTGRETSAEEADRAAALIVAAVLRLSHH